MTASGVRCRHRLGATFFELRPHKMPRQFAGLWQTKKIKKMKTFIQTKKEAKNMDKYVCTVCGYIYDPEQGDPDNGVAAGTKWEDVPDDWECPICGASKDDFEKEE